MIRLLALEKPTPDYVHTVYVLCVHHERDSCSRASQCQSLFLSGFASNTCPPCPEPDGRAGREEHDHALLILCSGLAEPGETEPRSHPAEADETPNRNLFLSDGSERYCVVNVNVDVGGARTALGRSYHGRGLDGCSYLPRVAELRTVRSMAYPEIHPNQESSD